MAVAIVVQARTVVMVEAIVAAVDNRSEVAHNLVAVVVVATEFAIVVADIVDMGLVAVALFLPLLQHNTVHSQLNVSMLYNANCD